MGRRGSKTWVWGVILGETMIEEKQAPPDTSCALPFVPEGEAVVASAAVEQVYASRAGAGRSAVAAAADDDSHLVAGLVATLR